jgi:hypothetical protein
MPIISHLHWHQIIKRLKRTANIDAHNRPFLGYHYLLCSDWRSRSNLLPSWGFSTLRVPEHAEGDLRFISMMLTKFFSVVWFRRATGLWNSPVQATIRDGQLPIACVSRHHRVDVRWVTRWFARANRDVQATWATAQTSEAPR